VSPALATGELDGARGVAHAIGIRHETIVTAELEREGYRANDRNRCYHCKTELYEQLSALAVRRRYAAVLSGANADDLGDWRPGLTAAAEYAVVHPLVDAGVGKEDVRELARILAIPSAEKPASPCLASRIPYGTAVEPDVLALIDRAELAVKALGYGVLRVRHFGALGRVELPEDALTALTADRRDAIAAAVAEAGYHEVEISDEPFRSGSLNASFTRRLAVTS
jgi:pyridinium-3,5-biscarboxylic acid mononucleotide sulfurtransferase